MAIQKLHLFIFPPLLLPMMLMFFILLPFLIIYRYQSHRSCIPSTKHLPLISRAQSPEFIILLSESEKSSTISENEDLIPRAYMHANQNENSTGVEFVVNLPNT